MAVITVPVELSEPTPESQRRIIASARKVLADSARLQREAGDSSLSAAEAYEKRATAVVRRAAGERAAIALKAANEFAQDTAASYMARRKAEDEQVRAERRAADASAAIARHSADQATKSLQERAAAEGQLRNVVVQSYADQEHAAYDFRDTLAEISAPAIATGAAAEIGRAAQDITGYFRGIAVAGAATVASLFVSFDKFTGIAATLNLVRRAAQGLKYGLWIPIRETARGVSSAADAIRKGLLHIQIAYTKMLIGTLTSIISKAKDAAVDRAKVRTAAWFGLARAIVTADTAFRGMGRTAALAMANVAAGAAKSVEWLGRMSKSIGTWALRRFFWSTVIVGVVDLTKAYYNLAKAGLPLVRNLEYTEVLLGRLAGSAKRASEVLASVDAARATGMPFKTEELTTAALMLERYGAGVFNTAEGITALSEASIVADTSIDNTARLVGELVQSLRLAADGSDESRRLIVEAIGPLAELGIVSQEAARRLAEMNQQGPQTAAAGGIAILTEELQRYRGVAEDVGDTYHGLVRRVEAETDRLERRSAAPFEGAGKWWQRIKLFTVETANALYDGVALMGRAMGTFRRQYVADIEAMAGAAQKAVDLAAGIPARVPAPIGPAGPVGAGDPTWRPSDEQRAAVDAAMAARELEKVYETLQARLDALTESEESAAEAAADLAQAQRDAFADADAYMAGVFDDARRDAARASEEAETRLASIRAAIVGHGGVEQATRDLQEFRQVLADMAADDLPLEARQRAWEGYIAVLRRADAAGVALTDTERQMIANADTYGDTVREVEARAASYTETVEAAHEAMNNGNRVVITATRTTTAWDHALARLGETVKGPVGRAMRDHSALVAGLELAWRKVSEGTADSTDLFLTNNDKMLSGLSGLAAGFTAAAEAAKAMSLAAGEAGRGVSGMTGLLSGALSGAPGGPAGMAASAFGAWFGSLTDALTANTDAVRAATRAFDEGLDRASRTLGLENLKKGLGEIRNLWFGSMRPDGTWRGGLEGADRARGLFGFGGAMEDAQRMGVNVGEVMGPVNALEAARVLNLYRYMKGLIEEIRGEEERRLKVVREISAAALEKARAVRSDLTGSYAGMTSALKRMAEAADSAFDVDGLDRAIDRMRELGLLTDDVADAYHALADAAHVNWREMVRFTEQFDLGQGHLGKGFEQARASGLGGELARAFSMLTDAGGDPFRVAMGMMRTAVDADGKESGHGGLEALIKRAADAGVLLPAELKPALDALAAGGVMAGQIGAVEYGDPMGTARKSLHDLLSEVSKAVHDAAIQEADDVVASIEAARDAQIEVVRDQTSRLVAAIEEGRISPEDISTFLGRALPDLLLAMQGTGVAASGPDGTDYGFDPDAFQTVLNEELGKLTPDSNQWAELVRGVNTEHGLPPDTIKDLADGYRNGIEIVFGPAAVNVTGSLGRLYSLLSGAINTGIFTVQSGYLWSISHWQRIHAIPKLERIAKAVEAPASVSVSVNLKLTDAEGNTLVSRVIERLPSELAAQGI